MFKIQIPLSRKTVSHYNWYMLSSGYFQFDSNQNTDISLQENCLTPQLRYMLSSGHFQFNSNVKFSPNQCVLSGCSQQYWAYSHLFKPLWNFAWANPPTFATKKTKTWLSLTNLWPRSQHPNSKYKQVQYIAFTSMIRIAASSQERYWLVNTLHWFVTGWW